MIEIIGLIASLVFFICMIVIGAALFFDLIDEKPFCEFATWFLMIFFISIMIFCLWRFYENFTALQLLF